jgi:hypothetical protein
VDGRVIASLVFMAVGPIVGLFTPQGPLPRDPGCIYGKVLDGHSGKIRCLSPEEVTPPGPYDTPVADGGADASDGTPTDAPQAPRRDAASDASSAVPLVPLSASIEGLTFEGGDVPRAAVALDRLKKDFLRCAANERGPLKSEATVELRFLVRAPGKAEGVDVGDAHGMSAELVRCVRSALAGRSVGAPSSDPVGVSFSLRMRKDERP